MSMFDLKLVIFQSETLLRDLILICLSDPTLSYFWSLHVLYFIILIVSQNQKCCSFSDKILF